MIKKKSQLLVYTRAARHNQGHDPYDKAKHYREASVPNDNEKAHEKQGEDGSIERIHAVRRQGEAQVHESRISREETPPSSALGCRIDDLAPSVYIENPWNEANNTEDRETPEVPSKYQRKGF